MIRWHNKTQGLAVIIGKLGVLALLLGACGPSLQTQCAEVISLVQTFQTLHLQTSGVETPDIAFNLAQEYQTLATALLQLELRDNTLTAYRDQLANGFQDVATAIQQRGEMADSRGIITYRPGSETEQAVKTMQAATMRAYNAVETTSHLIGNYCPNTR